MLAHMTEPRHHARQINLQVATTTGGRTVVMVLEMKKREARVKIKKEQENPSTIPPDILGPSSEPAQHTDRKVKRNRTTIEKCA